MLHFDKIKTNDMSIGAAIAITTTEFFLILQALLTCVNLYANDIALTVGSNTIASPTGL